MNLFSIRQWTVPNRSDGSISTRLDRAGNEIVTRLVRQGERDFDLPRHEVLLAITRRAARPCIGRSQGAKSNADGRSVDQYQDWFVTKLRLKHIPT
jgi:hypothetical protein